MNKATNPNGGPGVQPTDPLIFALWRVWGEAAKSQAADDVFGSAMVCHGLGQKAFFSFEAGMLIIRQNLNIGAPERPSRVSALLRTLEADLDSVQARFQSECLNVRDQMIAAAAVVPPPEKDSAATAIRNTAHLAWMETFSPEERRSMALEAVDKLGCAQTYEAIFSAPALRQKHLFGELLFNNNVPFLEVLKERWLNRLNPGKRELLLEVKKTCARVAEILAGFRRDARKMAGVSPTTEDRQFNES